MRLLIKALVACVLLLLLPVVGGAGVPGFMKARMGTMEGQIYFNDEPLPEHIVAFFPVKKGLPPLAGGMRRVPDVLVLSDSEGSFSGKLMAGEYYIGVLDRQLAADKEKRTIGPPREDETFYFAQDEKGKLRKVSLDFYEQVDVGSVNVALPETFTELEDFFVVEGRVVKGDRDEPYVGAVILAKRTLNTPRPDYISMKTADDGSFSLRMAPGRPFYLLARQSISGARPQPGEYMGTYGVNSVSGVVSIAIGVVSGGGNPPPGVLDGGGQSQEQAMAVSGSKGETVRDVVIRMFEVPDPNAIKQSLLGQTGSPKFEAGVSLNYLYFASNGYTLGNRSYRELDRWADFLKGQPGLQVEVGGHADSVGAGEYNQRLSERRARCVADYLISKGVDADRIMVKGYGATRPVAGNETEAGRARNRRVEITFIR